MLEEQTKPAEEANIHAAPLSENALVGSKQQNNSYQGYTITVPIFGTIPLTPREIIRDLKVRSNPPIWAQVFKYGIFGVLATLVLALIWVIARIYYPEHLDPNLPAKTLKMNTTYVMLIAFVFTNIVSYTTNRLFVFTPGRHSFIREISLFFLISGVSFVAGDFAKNWFIDLGLHTDIAVTSFAITSAVVNFLARKYFVFSNET